MSTAPFRPRFRGLLLAASSLSLAAGVAACGSGGDEGGTGGNTINATTGAEVFDAVNCSSCHQLAASGAEGRIGPNLDEVKPSADLVKRFVTDGAGSMPAFKNRLTPEQIEAVSQYVAEVAGQ